MINEFIIGKSKSRLTNNKTLDMDYQLWHHKTMIGHNNRN